MEYETTPFRANAVKRMAAIDLIRFLNFSIF